MEEKENKLSDSTDDQPYTKALQLDTISQLTEQKE